PPADEPVADDSPEDPPAEQPDVEPSQPSESPNSEPTVEPTPDPTQPSVEQAPVIDQQPPPNPVVVAGETITLTVAVSGNPPPDLQWQYADPRAGSSGGGDGDGEAVAAAYTSAPQFWLAPTTSGTPYVDSDPTPGEPADGTTDDIVEPETPGDETPAAEVSDGETPADELPAEEDWVDLAGETSETLVIDEPTADLDGRAFRVKATNPLGTITTEAAVISVQYPPSVEAHPQNVTVEEGGTATFEATAVANPDAMTITWQVRAPGGEWDAPDTSIATTRTEGVTSTLELTGVGSERNGYRYRAVFRNDVGEAASEPATLTVHWKPEITEQPESVEAGPGDDVEFTASASANPEGTWAWESAPSSGGPWTPVPDATGSGPDAGLTVSGVALEDDGTRYRAVFTNELGTATTAPAELDVVRAGRFEVDLGEHGTRCLVVDGQGAPRAGDCADAPSRGWEVPGDGTIIWRATGQCLDGVHPIDAVLLATCDDSNSQQWHLDPESSSSQTIKSVKYHSFVLDIEQVAPDGRLILFPAHQGVNQLFRYIQP
ncbi:hypothetical protein E1212_27705, partial [Jiangella ureilytica]